MGNSDDQLLKCIRHYQDSLERHSETRNDAKLQHAIEKLYKLPIKTSHLEATGIGRTVNGLRKLGGDVSNSAKALVSKWKEMVVVEEDKDKENQSRDDEDDDDDSEDNDTNDDSREDMEDERPSHKSRDERQHHSSRKRRSDSSEDGDSDSKDSKSSSSSSEDDDAYDRKKHKRKRHSPEVPPEPVEEPKAKKSRSGDDNHHQQHSYSQPQQHRSREESKSKSSSKSRHESSTSRSSSKSSKPDKERSSSSKPSSGSREEKQSKAKDEAPKPKEEKRKEEDLKPTTTSNSGSNGSREKHKSKHSDRSDKDRKNSDKSKDKENGKEERRDKEHKSSKSGDRERKHDEDKHKKSVEKKSSSKDKDKEKEKSKRPKEKSASKSEKSLNGIDSGSGASFAEALGMCAPVPKKKSGSDKPKPSSTTSSSSSHQSTSSKQHTKSDNKGSSSRRREEPAETEMPKLLKEPVPEALDISIESLLPDIKPNYRPLGNVVYDNGQPMRPLVNDYEALSRVISSKNQRTKVYSGNKVFWGKVPSLFELCVRVLQDNIDALEYTGGVPYTILKPILEKCNPDQLYTLEHHNPYLIEDTDELWQLHCQKEFKTKQREEMETWRDMYIRCLDEREAKLKALTANIKQSQDKSLPVRTTKLAYVDSIVKPPRDVVRRQLKNGQVMDKRPAQTPSSRLAALATAGEAGRVAVPSPGVRAAESSRSGSSSSAMKPAKKAPLMQKTLSFMKNRFKR